MRDLPRSGKASELPAGMTFGVSTSRGKGRSIDIAHRSEAEPREAQTLEANPGFSAASLQTVHVTFVQPPVEPFQMLPRRQLQRFAGIN